jgi:hypothetical protein
VFEEVLLLLFFSFFSSWRGFFFPFLLRVFHFKLPLQPRDIIIMAKTKDAGKKAQTVPKEDKKADKKAKKADKKANKKVCCCQ